MTFPAETADKDSASLKQGEAESKSGSDKAEDKAAEAKSSVQDGQDKSGSESAANTEDKEPAATAASPEKKTSLFSFPSTGTSGAFGSFGAGFGSFGSSGFGTTTASFGASGATSGAFGSGSFGGFGSAPSFAPSLSFSFSNAPTQADAFKAKKKEDGDGDGDGDDGGDGGAEDNEKEVPVEKTCQLEEVETCTGEEDETNVFQAPFPTPFVLYPPSHCRILRVRTALWKPLQILHRAFHLARAPPLLCWPLDFLGPRSQVSEGRGFTPSGRPRGYSMQSLARRGAHSAGCCAYTAGSANPCMCVRARTRVCVCACALVRLCVCV